MPTTPINGFPYPALSDNPNGPLAVGNLAADVDAKMPRGALRSLLLSGNTGVSGGYVAVGSTSTIVLPAGRLINARVAAQFYFVGAAGQQLRVSVERWSAGVLQRAFGGRIYDITTSPQLIAVVLDDDDQPGAGSYQYKVAAGITGTATNNYVDTTSVPTGRDRTARLLITDLGPVPSA